MKNTVIRCDFLILCRCIKLPLKICLFVAQSLEPDAEDVSGSSPFLRCLMRVDVRKITNLMCEKELNQMQLAKGAGVSQTTITAVMKRGSAKVGTLGKLARYLSCEPGELVKI